MFLKVVWKIEYVFVLALMTSIFLTTAFNEAEEDEDPDETNEWEEEEPEATKMKPPEGMQTISFKPANLTDEDQHSQHMPRDLLCDGCRIVAYVMKEKLKKIQSRYKKGHRLSESDIIDVLDDVCEDKENKFDQYGIKDVKGKRRLTGDGLETKDEPGIMQGGGKWPYRLHQMCEQYVGNLGEDVIYEAFLESGSLERLFCYSEENGKICSPKKTKTTKKSKEEL